MRNLAAAVIDIGSPARKNLGWAFNGNKGSASGGDLDECVEICAGALRSGPLALGFEAPLFVPMRATPEELTRARIGECVGGVNRAFSVNAGAAALVTALVVVPYVLAGLRRRAPDACATFDWRAPLKRSSLLLFEAFVTNQKSDSESRHIEDSKRAIAAFQVGMRDPMMFQSAISEAACLNLVAASLLRTGWSIDVDQLSLPCLVVRA